MKKIIEIEIGLPKSIVQYEGEPITTMISTEQLQEELNLQLLQPDVISSFSNLDEAAQRYSDDWENITGLEYEDEYPEAINKLDFINGAKWQQEQIGKSEFLQRLRGTLSDAEARRLIFETFKNK